MGERPRGAWVGAGLVLTALAVLAVLLAGVLLPVADGRPLKMSCYWAMRAVLAPWLAIGAVGLLLSAATERGPARAAAAAVALASPGVPLVLHLLVPVMPHNLPKAYLHDILSLVALLVALAAWRAAAPETDLDAALDALAPAAEQPGA